MRRERENDNIEIEGDKGTSEHVGICELVVRT